MTLRRAMRDLIPALILALSPAIARADSISLDTGATLTGDLARYELGGDCQISVTQGELRGVILVLPCRCIQSFVRAEPPAQPVFADAPALADAPILAAEPVVREAPLEPAPPIPAPVIPPLGLPVEPAAPAGLPEVPEGGASPAEARSLRF